MAEYIPKRMSETVTESRLYPKKQLSSIPSSEKIDELKEFSKGVN